MTSFKLLTVAMGLSPLAKNIVTHMEKAGSISAREAMADMGITSASLTRRMTDIEAAGIPIKRERREHPITKQKFTRYSLDLSED